MSERLSPTKIAALWAAVLVLLAVAAVSVITLVNHNVFGPGNKVKELQAHLVAGDGSAALGLLQAKVPKGNGLLLDGEGLRAASSGIKDFSVGKPEPVPGSGKVVQVTASYNVQGVAKQTNYQLQSTGRNWLFFDRWEFVPSILPTVQITANTTNAVRINDLPAPLNKGATTVPVFTPAVINAGFETPNFEAATRGIVVTNPDAQGTKVKLRTEPTKALLKDVNGQIKKYLDDCASQQVLMPANCPMSYSTAARVRSDSIHWNITGYPKAEIVSYNGEWVLRPLSVKTRLDLTEQNLRTGVYTERSVDDEFGFTAVLKVSTTKARVTPVSSK